MNIVENYKTSVSSKTLIKWVGLPRSSYYYKSSGEKKGIKPSVNTMKQDGSVISNKELVKVIEQLLLKEFICYGYLKVAY